MSSSPPEASAPVPCASVVVPAHDEEVVIGRCLAALLAGAGPGELDVVVVANGCTDRTAQVARSFPGVRVVETPVASKPAALNLGDEAVAAFPRIYLDADVVVSTEAVRAVAEELRSGSCEAAAPRIQFELAGGSRAVRAYYRTWTALPWLRDAHVGSAGFYGLSAAGRARFGAFPDIVADDLFVDSVVPPSQRRRVDAHAVVVHPPRSLRSLLAVRTRVHGANARDAELFGDAVAATRRGQRRALLRLARQPRRLPALALYVGVNVVAKVAAARRNRQGLPPVWDRDHTARAGIGEVAS